MPEALVPDEIAEPSAPNVLIPPPPLVVVPPPIVVPPLIIVPPPPAPSIDATALTPQEPRTPEIPPEAVLPLPGELNEDSSLPANVGSNVLGPENFRVGYADYLRTAEVSQIIAAAVPGVAGMLLLTIAGGFVGHRQANAGRAVRTNGTARFLP